MFGLGTPELIVILIILLVLFGGSQLPKLARNLGQAGKELRDGLNGDDDKKAENAKDTKAETEVEAPKRGRKSRKV